MIEKPYQICTRCVMDTTDPNITFDENGVCNHCKEYEQAERTQVFTGEEGIKRLERLVLDIKEAGKDKSYDSILGLSGGVDSTYVAYLAWKYRLRPLAVHLDNGWNTDVSNRNIENIIKKTGFDLHTIHVDAEEFKDLQLAFLKASVVDIESTTDHAIIATMYRLAQQYGIKYFLSGTNVVTEQILPKAWIWSKTDSLNIKDIHKKYGTRPLRSYPFMSPWKMARYSRKGIRTVSFLNYVPYVKNEIKKVIAQELQWEDYGGKHYESVFTRFYQCYILPVKFGVDKRKAHFSTLICSGQMTREEALSELKQPICPPDMLEKDKLMALQKLGLTTDEFDRLMDLPIQSHSNFAHAKRTIYDTYPWLKPLRPIMVLKNK